MRRHMDALILRSSRCFQDMGPWLDASPFVNQAGVRTGLWMSRRMQPKRVSGLVSKCRPQKKAAPTTG